MLGRVSPLVRRTRVRCAGNPPCSSRRALRRRAGARTVRYGDGLPGGGPETPSAGRDQDIASGARRGARCRAVPARDRDGGSPATSPYPPPLRLRAGGRVPVLCHAVRRVRVATRSPRPGETAVIGGDAADHLRSGGRGPLRPTPPRPAPRTEAREP